MLLRQIKSRGFKFCADLIGGAGLLRLISLLVGRLEQRTTEVGHIQFPFIQKRVQRSMQIVLYHGVSNEPSPYLPTTSVDVFRNHMQYLADYCHVLDLQDAVERMEAHDLPDRAVVVTLDDGYRDNYVHVFPILKQLGITATIFLATGVIGNGGVLWHDQVCRMISQTTMKTLRKFGSVDGYCFETSEGRQHAQEGILWFLRSLEDEVRSEHISRLARELEVPETASDAGLMLNWQEVKEMHHAGIHFGAHTVTHPILTRISREQVVQEIRHSKMAIERELENEVLTFAYPSGRGQDINPEIKDIVKQEGFRCAVSTMAGSNRETDDMFEMKRVGFWDREMNTFGLRFEHFRFCA